MSKFKETSWTLKTPDGAVLHGVTNSKGKADKAIFIAHGLTGHMYEYPLKRAADVFATQGYDVYRVNFYGGEKGERSLVDCTISIHAADLNAVLKKFGKPYKQRFLIGHSYGGTTVMLAKAKDITAASLWDPSFNLARVQESFSSNYKKLTGLYSVEWGTTFLIGKSMYDEAAKLDEKACIALAKACPHPVQVVHAGEGFYVKDKISYHSFGHPKNRHDIVKGTTHCFYEGTSCDRLLKKTQTWFESWS